jgi:hypothetical protein
LKVSRVDLITGKREHWREIVPADPTALIDVEMPVFRMTPDGKSYAYTTWRYPSDLYLVEGLK